jgi:tetratricopeptide (TPR) repeat protein
VAVGAERRGAQVSDRRFGPYTVESELGSGGMGTVYRARGPAGVVALKVAHEHICGNPNHLERFVREGEAGRAIRHPNVVATLDTGTTAGRPWIALEYVEGQTLRGLLGEIGVAPEELCRRIGVEILRGLVAIHAAGVVHRDLKPDNVLITREHAVRIMDLGLARVSGLDSLTESGVFVGTAAYAAPEQFSGTRTFDGRTDLHAVGVLLYELASGTHPYRSDDFRTIAMRVTKEAPRRLGDVHPQVSPFLEEFVHRLLAKEASGRFASAAEALDLLEKGEASEWWTGRTREIRLATRRPPRRARVPRETALFGREAEIARLRDVWNRVRAGTGQVMLIEGEAGIGKTRLLDEFVTGLREGGERFHLLEGGWPPGGAATASGAFATAYREHLGDEGLESSLRVALPDTPALVPSFAAMLRGDAPPEGAAPLTREALQTLFVHVTRSIAAELPTIVVIEELGFAPEDGRALFAALAAAVPTAPVLLVGTMRPGPVEAWAAELARPEHATRIVLGRLGPRELVRLLADALRSEHLAEELSARIAVKSDGNPYFVFEILRTLKEGRLLAKRGDGSWATTQVVREIRIPESVRELIEARLAELSDDDLEILRVAACEGFTFDPLLVGTVVGLAPLPLLKRLGAVELRQRLVRSVGRRYEFDHHQVQEVLAAGLSDLHRETYHAALGEALEARERAAERDPETLDGGLCVALAEHFLRGAKGDRALRYLRPALRHLERQNAHAVALTIADLALASPGLATGALRLHLLLRRVTSLNVQGRRAEQRAALEEAVALAKQVGDPGALVRALLLQAHYFYAIGESGPEAEAPLVEGIALARDAGLVGLEASAELSLGYRLYNAGQWIDARPHWQRARDLARSAGEGKTLGGAEGALGHAFVAEGRYDEACAAFQRSVAIAEELGDPDAQAAALGNLGMALCEMGRVGDAIDFYRRAISMAREQGARRNESISVGNLANALYLAGRFAEALPQFERQIALAREMGDRMGETVALVNLGALHQALGDVEGARSLLLDAVAAAQSLGALHPLGHAQNALGALFVQTGEHGEAQRWLDAALATRRTIRNRPEAVATDLDRALLLATVGRRDDAVALLREVRDVAHVLGLRPSRAIASGRLAALGALSAGEAAEDLRAAEPAMPRMDVVECARDLHLATGDASWLARAQAVAAEILDRAPPERRAAMRANVPILRSVLGPSSPPGGAAP